MVRTDNARLRHHRDGVDPTGDVPGLIPLDGEGLAGLDPLGTGPTADAIVSAGKAFLNSDPVTGPTVATVHDWQRMHGFLPPGVVEQGECQRDPEDQSFRAPPLGGKSCMHWGSFTRYRWPGAPGRVEWRRAP
jgi:hypothetical protein